MNQNVTYSRPVDLASLGAGFEQTRVWRGTINAPGAGNYAEYFAFFNLGEQPVTLHTTWKQLGLEGAKHLARNVWTESDLKDSKEVKVTLPPHGSTVYELR